ncbi:MAG TPA: hypothetical protein VKX96_13440 [Chloroflexota bacterium]|nr:hypothetical protein [Chloroflexota bacterium]
MLFFVKSQCEPGKVDELTRKVINGEITKVRGNIVFLSPDGTTGYDIVEADSEADVRAKYAPYSNYLRLVEVSQVVPAHEYYANFEKQHMSTAAAQR